MSAPLLELFGGAGEAAGLPPVPDESVWPFLDAATRCIERYGWARTSVRDVAREAGVERTTVYRRVGSMEQIFRLVVARELHRLMADIPTAIPPGASGSEIVINLLAAAVEHSWAHPVVAKVLVDEPELIGAFLAQGVPDLVGRATATLSPLLAAAMDAGVVARRDPVIVTEWIVRIGLSLLVAPPPADLRAFLTEALGPLLTLPRGGLDD